MTGIAALPMYDLPELRAATDSWWQVIARALRAEGVPDVPAALERAQPVSAVWRNPLLVLSQTCGYPLTHDYSASLTAIAVPSYTAEGCTPGRYRSAFLVRADEGEPAYSTPRWTVIPRQAGHLFQGKLDT